MLHPSMNVVKQPGNLAVILTARTRTPMSRSSRPDEVERYCDTHCLVICPALNEGKVVYDAF